MADESKRLGVPAHIHRLGGALVWARGLRGVSGRDLSAAMGVSAPYVADVEHGRRSLSQVNVERAAAFLGVEVADLEVRRGWARDLAEWVASDPDLVRTLREAQQTGARVVLEQQEQGLKVVR